MNYLQRILCDFNEDLSRININVDGFKIADGEPSIIGTGWSCGVDSMSTVYDRYVNEDDPDYRVNALFFHAFAFTIYPNPEACGKVCYLANYSCMLALQRTLKIYYAANSLSYIELLKKGITFRNHDLFGFSDAFHVSLIRTEDAHNCSVCYKCMRTLIAIEAMGKLEEFSEAFDIEAYRKHSFAYKCDIVLNRKNDLYKIDNYNFALKHGLKMPSSFTARMYFFSRWLWYRGLALPKKILRKIIGDKLYDSLKHTLKR